MMKYFCNQCDYSSSYIKNVKRHTEIAHEGIGYPCELCDFSATRPSQLRTHKRSKHEEFRYSCDQCAYSASCLPYLKRHKESTHSKKSEKEMKPIWISSEAKLYKSSEIAQVCLSILITIQFV